MLRKLLVLSLVGIFLFPTAATGANESFSLKDIGKPGEAVFTIIEPEAGTIETSVSTLAVQPSAVIGDGQRGYGATVSLYMILHANHQLVQAQNLVKWELLAGQF